MPVLGQSAGGLGTAEAFLNELAQPPVCSITRMQGGVPVDPGLAPLIGYGDLAFDGDEGACRKGSPRPQSALSTTWGGQLLYFVWTSVALGKALHDGENGAAVTLGAMAGPLPSELLVSHGVR